MADRDVLIKPRKVLVTPSTTITNLLARVSAIKTVPGGVGEASQDEIFAVPIDGTAGLFIGDVFGKVQGATQTTVVQTALTPVTTQTGLLPRDLLAEAMMTDANTGNFLLHMYDQNASPTVTDARHRAVSLLQLRSYIGGEATKSIGKVKVDEADGADWLENKIVSGISPSCISMSIGKTGSSSTRTIEIKAIPNLSGQFLVTGAKQLTIQTINGGSI
jgi:hypothetical protein